MQSSACVFIEKWLNYEFNLGVNEYPKSIIESEGELLMKMVNRIAGKNLLKKPELSGNKLERISGLYNYYCDAIKALKIEGAFLNQIRPDFLLSDSDYIAFGASRDLKKDEGCRFKFTLVRSWVTIFYQLCKLFILPQISEKSMQKLFKFEQLPKSTIYSEP